MVCRLHGQLFLDLRRAGDAVPLLLNGRGQHAEALAPAQSAAERDELMLSVLSLPSDPKAA
jgi:hypothetical protein